MRLRSRSSSPQPGQSTEGVYTCEIMGEGLVSVGLYYSSELYHIDMDVGDNDIKESCQTSYFECQHK